MDLDRRLLWKANEEVHLTPKEFDLLSYLFKNEGAVVTHVKLLRGVWGPEYGNELEYLRTYIRILRKKIEDDPARPQYILTEPWAGYRFRNPSDPRAQSVTERLLFCLAAKVSPLFALGFPRGTLEFERGRRFLKRLLITTKPSIPTVILRDDATPD
jgi:hypothetical protein